MSLPPIPRWTPAREDRLRELWPDKSIKLRTIATEMGISTSALSQAARKLGLTPRYAVNRNVEEVPALASCNFTNPEYAYLTQAAEVRSLTVRKLLRSIVKTVVQEKMIDAILDDHGVVAAE